MWSDLEDNSQVGIVNLKSMNLGKKKKITPTFSLASDCNVTFSSILNADNKPEAYWQ